MLVTLNIQKLSGVVQSAKSQISEPRPDGHIGNAVLFEGDKDVFTQLFIEYIQQTFGFHGVTVDRILVFLGCIAVKVTKTTPQKRS